MTKRIIDADSILNRARPIIQQQAHEIQPYGHVVTLPIALAVTLPRGSSRRC